MRLPTAVGRVASSVLWPGPVVVAAVALGVAVGCGGPRADDDSGRYEIAYVRATAGGGTALFLADDGGRRERAVMQSDGSISGLAWSPDGERLAFAVCDGGESTPCALHSVAADGGDPREEGEGRAPYWSPDGGRIAFVKPRGEALELYVTDSGQDAPRLKTAGLSDDEPSGVETPTVSPWSPDGSTLAVTLAPATGEAAEVMLVRGDGLRERRAADDLEGAWFGGWAPSGGSMLLLGDSGDEAGVYLADAEGRVVRRIAALGGALTSGVRTAWAADGRRVAVGTTTGVVVIDIEQGEPRRIAGGACEGAGGIGWTSSGAIWFTRGCDGAGRVMVETDIATGSERVFAAAGIEFSLRVVFERALSSKE
ncbi:MAG: TolB family protein [Dehalococcoidia bacterium]